MLTGYFIFCEVLVQVFWPLFYWVACIFFFNGFVGILYIFGVLILCWIWPSISFLSTHPISINRLVPPSTFISLSWLSSNWTSSLNMSCQAPWNLHQCSALAPYFCLECSLPRDPHSPLPTLLQAFVSVSPSQVFSDTPIWPCNVCSKTYLPLPSINFFFLKLC